MKAIIYITLFSLFVCTLTSCTKDEVPEEAQVSIIFENVVDEQGLQENTPFTYTNKFGNRYNVSALKYIISNVVLIDLGDNEVELNNFTLMNLGGGQLPTVSLPNGTYKSMRFTLGVDTPQNLSAFAEGDLVPGSDMHINTTDGYIFFKHEGEFLDASSVEQDITINYSGTNNAKEILMPVGGLTVNGVAKTAFVTFNLNAVYDDMTDFNNGATEVEITPTFTNAFSFSGSYEND